MDCDTTSKHIVFTFKELIHWIELTKMAGILTKDQTEKGFVLPEGYTWDAKLIDGKKEGKVTVEDEYGCISCVLHFHDDKLNGLCEFYELGCLVERRTFVNGIEEGWGCEIENWKEVKGYLYANGVRIAELKNDNDMPDYWKAVDMSSNQLISICKYDNGLAVDKGYIFDKGRINRIVIFENGKERNVLKVFEGDKMTENDNSGNRIYEGGFVDDLSNEYPREGKGMEFKDRVLVYAGEWKNGKREGQGHTVKNRVAEYIGEWKEGLPNGKGILNRDGQLYEGNWVMGKLEVSEGEWYDYMSVEENMDNALMVIEDENQLRELLKNEDKKRTVKELVIGRRCGIEMKDDLELCGFKNLERLRIGRKSLMRLHSLKISNNPVLKSIETEDDDSLIMNDRLYCEVFQCVEVVVIESDD